MIINYGLLSASLLPTETVQLAFPETNTLASTISFDSLLNGGHVILRCTRHSEMRYAWKLKRKTYKKTISITNAFVFLFATEVESIDFKIALP